MSSVTAASQQFTKSGCESSVTARAIGTSHEEKVDHCQDSQGVWHTKFEFLSDPVGEVEEALDLSQWFRDKKEHYNREATYHS